MKTLSFLATFALAASLLASTAHAQQQRGSLGITMADNARPGVAILNVVPGSPAAKIGLLPGDRILAVDGKAVLNNRDVTNLIQRHKPNSRIELRVDRGGWTNTLSVTLGVANQVLSPPAVAAPVPPTRVPSAPVRQGSLVSPSYLDDLTPADIDDQHGYGG